MVNLDRGARAIIKQTNHEVLAEQGKAVRSATVIRNSVALADGLMTGIDQLRRHEARAASEDPVVADEYARIRRAVADLGLNEINRYGQRPWL
ncbi:hypothetical protein [Amycolatopsis sp. NPDC059657]|uniref:hypothetical protein n=1 Tax=Amycolatopsis sp. NPDC059657 TaxID=3346899 RepID=UPI00366ADB06